MRYPVYSSLGNTFIMVDSSKKPLTIPEKKELIMKEAKDVDGVVFLEIKDGSFFMDYFNKDGSRAFCGNGARAFVMFLRDLGYIDNHVVFRTIEGDILGWIEGKDVIVKMPDPIFLGKRTVHSFEGVLIKVGVPHFLVEHDDIEKLEIEKMAPCIRKELDANVDFYKEIKREVLRLRTYERGVEGETKACGTGATALAWYYKKDRKYKGDTVEIIVNGGKLFVIFKDDGIYLKGGVERW